MIPLRLLLENFMCYRDTTEIDFRGSTIWAFSGHNGSGKSTIFDAIRYALYGEHRAGKQKSEALIHRSKTAATSFVIEFDFALGENEYRLHRTCSQKKKTMQVLHLSGPDAPHPGRPGPQFITGTDLKEGFDVWIRDHIGLDERAFTVSVLLLQGQSDKLLKLGGPERHDVLTHIIDLSRYDALAKKALKKQSEQESEVKTFKRLLDGLEVIDEAMIGIVEQRMGEARERKELARSCHLALITFKEQARRWVQLQEEERYLLEELARCEQLLAQAEQITRNAERYTTLQQVLPPLAQIQQRQTERQGLQQEIEQHHETIATMMATIERIGEERQKALQGLEIARTAYQQCEQEYRRVQSDLRALQVPCNDIERLYQKQQAQQELLASLATFDPDLEAQRTQLQERLDEMSGIEEAIPLLQKFASYRHAWQQTTLLLDRLTQELHDHGRTREQTMTRLQSLQETLVGQREQVSQIRGEVEGQKARVAESQGRFERFHSIQGGATCDYCGQPLTAAHLDAERQRIEAELQERTTCLKQRIAQFNAASQQQKEMERDILLLEKQVQQQEERRAKLLEQQSLVLRKRDAAYIGVKHQVEWLAPAYIVRMQDASGNVDVDTCLQASYPTGQDLETLACSMQDKPAVQQQLQTVEDALARWEELCRKQEYLLAELEPLLQTYPSERIAALVEEQRLAQQREQELTEILEERAVEIEQYEQRLAHLDGEEPTVRDEYHRREQARAVASTNLHNAQQALTELQRHIPAAWQKQLPSLSSEQLAQWRQELAALQGAEEQQQALFEARHQQGRHQQALRERENERCLFPEEARRTPELVQEEIEQIDSLYQELEKQERACSAEAQRLRGIQERRQDLQRQWTEAKRLASRYKELAHLLGREGLQHYLLQNAETGILLYANEMLDCISGGTLRLELRVDAGSKTKALDMVAYNAAISDQEPQAIDLLSGSQQFRVAISLAIGIGRYMGNANHRVESIMIDEGFGSLDAESRDEMTLALQALEEDFKRIIVVSHQNEFSDKFPNRYETRLVDGQTVVTLV